MTEVGIRELKADLSALLKRAAAGEQIRVTMRGEPFVDLVAATPASSEPDLQAMFDRYAAAGILTAPTRPLDREPWPKFAMTGSPADLIIEERDEERRR